MHFPNLILNPLCVLALWDGQTVEFNGVLLRFNSLGSNDPNQEVIFTTTDSVADATAYDKDLLVWMNGTPGVHQPVYSDYYRHLRRNGTYAKLTRLQFVEALKTGTCSIV